MSMASRSTSSATPDALSLTERRRARRDQLLNAAIDVIRREGADVTMEEMATAGGISKPILYRHFTDRDGLVAAITDTRLVALGYELDEKLATITSANPIDVISATIDVFFDHIENEPELYRFIVDHDARAGNAATHAFVEQVSAHVAAAIATGLEAVGRDTAPAPIWGRAVVGMCQNTAEWWMTGGADIDRAELVDSLTTLVAHGMVGTR